jgi:hypothetical protein
VGPAASLDAVEKRKLLTSVVQPVESHYTDYAIAALSLMVNCNYLKWLGQKVKSPQKETSICQTKLHFFFNTAHCLATVMLGK